MTITGTQIRLARIALRWSVEELSEVTKVSTSTIKRIEAADGIPSSTHANLMAIQSALETAGIQFIGTPDKGPGIRLWKDGGPAANDAAPGSA
jgi:transcriptional regulator with XRE-family HTH domain